MKETDFDALHESATAFPRIGAGADMDRADATVIPFHRYTDYDRRWPVPGKGEVLVVPLGGLGRIGMNWTLYGHDGAWVLVDAGIAFPDPDTTGVDCIVPHPAFLAPIRDRLLALVVTHAHEDHIGGIDRLWPQGIDCPIYATPFATKLIARRLDEAGVLEKVELNSYPVGGAFNIGPFGFRSIRMTHSIPEPVALAIDTAAGTVLHTGDWKFDPEPGIGQATDFDALRKLGDDGVLAMLCDSTNAHKDLPSTSEAQVRRAFDRLFATRKGQIAICCFATNVARVASAISAAADAGRQVALAGRSMRNCEEVARDLGLLSHVPEPLTEPAHLKGLDRDKVALICTGGQGEEKAALAKLARGERRFPPFGAGDTVVLSARVIPGNEESVEKVVSKLRARGVEVLMGHEVMGGEPLHVSGHPGANELRELYALVRPRIALPVHGTDMHLAAHARLARAAGCQAAIVAEEAEVIRLSDGGSRVLGRVNAPLLSIESEPNGDRATYDPGKVLVAGQV
ncbi:ribonuclease J [Niveispirillum cyanobacteriorum]|uniref:MBL fold hydrolase n=1 Tax=Niveispirillum cyanobacteriorum TaxID=1612173 RepID=A0A2K9NHB4_9PROT|nr:ribonuclease J [Niveispirillum cyanobacteriorum]AUN32494.1 MBL fold hydrolase [Niveispirillum cyanobacteriorum]GGE77940.1 MBL fold hydrolase [Niveispirillum cyanobacteriorum]